MEGHKNTAKEGFEVYKGLQSPLMFKGFKGRYIYIGGAFIMGGFILAVIIITTIGNWPGLFVLLAVWGYGYVHISRGQKKGLHNKKKKKGIFIVVNKYKIRKLEHQHGEKTTF